MNALNREWWLLLLPCVSLALFVGASCGRWWERRRREEQSWGARWLP